MKEGFKANSKKRQVSSTSGVLCIAVSVCVIALSVIMVVRSLYISSPNNESIASVDIREYERLLERAKELARKYTSIGGTDALPEGIPSVLLNQYDALMPETKDAAFLKADSGSSNQEFSSFAKTDLVLGMAQDTDAKNLVVFCRSLRSVSNADATIFINKPIPPRHAAIAKENRITLVGFDLEEINPASMRKFHPSTLRWYLFHNYFKADPAAVLTRYDRIWTIDVRDSYFQSDPFAFVPVTTGSGGAAAGGSSSSSTSTSTSSSSFHVFSGVESFPIKECGWNSGWVKDCFGAGVLQDIGSKGIICSGVSAGTAGAVLDYLRIMSDIVSGGQQQPQQHVPAVNNRFPSCERNGVDQGVHNVLVHTGALDHLHLRKWGQADGPVANMQSRLASVQCAGEGEQRKCTVKNKAGVAVAVVHQYDRYPDLQKHLFAKYVDWVRTGDLQAEWEYEPACRQYAYKADSDLFKGICDVKAKGGVTAAASCCALCDQLQGCKAFTFFAGSCFFKSCGAGQGSAKALPGAVSGFLKS